MTKAEIIAELRRSAREDQCCYDCADEAFDVALSMRTKKPLQVIGRAPEIKWRTYYLFVAHALEDE